MVTGGAVTPATGAATAGAVRAGATVTTKATAAVRATGSGLIDQGQASNRPPERRGARLA